MQNHVLNDWIIIFDGFICLSPLLKVKPLSLFNNAYSESVLKLSYMLLCTQL